MMTPGDFASLQEGREGLSTEDYIAWRLPYVPVYIILHFHSSYICVRILDLYGRLASLSVLYTLIRGIFLYFFRTKG